MAIMEAHDIIDGDYGQSRASGMPDGYLGRVAPASPEMVKTVLEADENSEDGRSQFMWIRLANGDLILGVYPQGDTYFDTELDVGRP